MQALEPDSDIEALDDKSLRDRLRLTNWSNAPLAVSDEQLFRLFRRAWRAGDMRRAGLLSEQFNRRLLDRGRRFALRANLVPRLIGDLKQASHQLATFIWERLLDPEKSDAAHAEVAFGQLFERRAIDFLRSLHPTRRSNEDSIDELDDDGDDGNALPAAEAHEELQNHETPDVLAARRQVFERTHARLQAILTTEEYETFVLLNVGGWQVKEIAAALNVSLKTVNNYKNRALAKIDKEFKQ